MEKRNSYIKFLSLKNLYKKVFQQNRKKLSYNIENRCKERKTK